MITYVAVVIGATFTILEIAGRRSNGPRSAMTLGLAASIPALALGLFDLRFLGLAIALYWLVLGLRTLARQRTRSRRGRDRGEHVATADDVRRSWPISGPIGRLGGIGMAVTWFTTQLLTLFNPFLMWEFCQQAIGNASLSGRASRNGEDGRDYLTKAVYTLPFAGEWLLGNGGHTPETSHSWNVLGQRFALDFVQANAAFERHTGRGTLAEEYFCYGREILAAADGTVVRVENRVRRAFLGWGICDFTARSFVGNHALIEHAEGEFALYAHLTRGSVIVSPGDRVNRGQVLGRCGHTGNSTEPHLHFHLQDSADLFWGMGLPARFSCLFVDGEPADQVLLTAGNRVRTNGRGESVPTDGPARVVSGTRGRPHAAGPTSTDC